MNENKTNINWYPGHMAKTRREVQEKLSLIDVVYEVIDSRMPISSKIVDMDTIVRTKPRILIMTKYDICDKGQTDIIADFYKKSGYIVVPVDLISGKGINQILVETNKIKDKMNLDRKEKGLKERDVRVLVIGAPNVGKSTLINKLVGRKATITGDKPGVTKNLSWVRVGKGIELLDSPGILWPKLDNQENAHILASFSSIKEEILDSESLCVFIIEKLIKLYPDLLKNRYKLDSVDMDTYSIIEKIGTTRGAIIKGGEVDFEKVYKLVINDLKEGLIGNITFDRI